VITLETALTAARQALTTVAERAERQGYYTGARTDIINSHAELRAALDLLVKPPAPRRQMRGTAHLVNDRANASGGGLGLRDGRQRPYGGPGAVAGWGGSLAIPPPASRDKPSRLHTEHEDIDRQLADLASDTHHGNDADLLDELPELAGRLADLPPGLQARLFAAFDIQILWNPPMRQATIHATITDTTPGIITALLTRAGDDDPTGSAADTASAPDDSHATSNDPFSGLSRLPIERKRCPHSAEPRPRSTRCSCTRS
jgi:hypothetical protein